MTTSPLAALLRPVYNVICSLRKQLKPGLLWLAALGTCHGCHGVSVEIIKEWTFQTVLWFAGIAVVVWVYGRFLTHLAIVLRDVREGLETIAGAEAACDAETKQIFELGKTILTTRLGAALPQSPSA